MCLIVVVSGSPVPASRTLAVAEHVHARLANDGFDVETVDVRGLPAEDLLGGQVTAAATRRAVSLLERAAGLVVVTPVYKAAYSGALKTLLDLLPQRALEGKVVVPAAVGGTLAHLLAIDYALRPVLASMGGPHVTGGVFLLDGWLPRDGSGAVVVGTGEVEERLGPAVQELALLLRRAHGAAPALVIAGLMSTGSHLL